MRDSILIAFGLLLVGSTAYAQDPCGDDDECTEGQYCLQVDCFGDDCPEGFCTDISTADPAPPAGCESSDDCAPGDVCVEECWDCPQDDFDCEGGCQSMCVPDEEPPMGACLSDGDCEPGAYCEVECETCEPGDDACMDYCFGTCISDEEPPMGACLSDGDCEPGTYCEVMCSDCDPDDEMCESICFGECVDDRMIEPECVVDEDCGPDAHCGVVAVSGCAAPSCPEGESCESMPCEEEMFYGCIDDPVSECMTNADCGEGFECASVGGVSNGMACGSDDDCLDAVPMPTEEFYACVPAECQTNEDCGPGLECLDFGWSVCPAIACADDDCPDVECEEVTEAYCAPAYIGGCEIAADCGEGFNCIAEEICECSGSGAVPPDGDREDAAPEMPWEDECTCSPSEDYYCEPIEAACLVDADCIEGWSCDQGMVSEPVLPGGPDGEDSVPAPQPDPVDPGMIDGVCVPPYGEFWTPDRNGGGYDEATESTTGHTDTNVEVPATPSVDDPSTDPTRPESEDGGCQVTPARAPLGALLGGLFGLVALRRRRR